jgi:hypothetical protein
MLFVVKACHSFSTCFWNKDTTEFGPDMDLPRFITVKKKEHSKPDNAFNNTVSYTPYTLADKCCHQDFKPPASLEIGFPSTLRNTCSGQELKSCVNTSDGGMITLETLAIVLDARDALLLVLARLSRVVLEAGCLEEEATVDELLVEGLTVGLRPRRRGGPSS